MKRALRSATKAAMSNSTTTTTTTSSPNKKRKLNTDDVQISQNKAVSEVKSKATSPSTTTTTTTSKLTKDSSNLTKETFGSKFQQHLLQLLEENQKASYAVKQQQYMKTTQFMYGLQAPERGNLLKETQEVFPITTFEELDETVRLLWKGKSRDEMYCAVGLISSHKSHYKKEDRVTVLLSDLIITSKWWDTLDALAAMFSEWMLWENRRTDLENQYVRKWLKDDDFWIRRAAILSHLKHKTQTNTALMEECIKATMHESEFFIRKSIGWILREYSKHGSGKKWVKDFITQNKDKLSPLSQKEGLKYCK